MLRLTGRIVLLTAFFLVGFVAHAQSVESPSPRDTIASGILTERISQRDYQRWEAIKRIVFARDAEGRPLHPTLQSLWERVDQSGHAVYIEIYPAGTELSNTAGAFRLERFDPLGVRHVAVIRLYPAVIDSAYISPSMARSNGFIPFVGLTREERYAEVLGHELAHALNILGDLRRARRVVEEIDQTNEQFLSQGRRYGYATLKPEMLERIIKRDRFLKELEDQVEAIESAIWSELAAGRELKGKKVMTALTKPKPQVQSPK